MRDVQDVIKPDLFMQPEPAVDGVKQVLESLKDKVTPLHPDQLRVINYLKYLQSRPIHNGSKPYQPLIDSIVKDAPKVGVPGFFIRVIEALIPRPVHLDREAFDKMIEEQQKEK